MKKYLLILIGLLCLMSLVPITYAQGDPDGDRVFDPYDLCPNTPGPKANAGCPYPTQIPAPTRDPNDSDGDGNPNNADRCPNEGGPASNGGCPETQPQPCPEGFTGANCEQPSTGTSQTPQTPLPDLPREGRCLLATSGRARVNVREIPDLLGAVVGQLEPFSTYPVYFHILGANPEDEWYLVDLGWVSGTVVRVGGKCRNIPMMRLPEPLLIHLGDLGLVFVGDEDFDPAQFDEPTPTELPNDAIPPFLFQVCDGSVRISWLEQDFRFCDGSVMPTDQMPNDEEGSAFECDGDFNFFEAFVGGDEVSLTGILIGLLLPAVNADGELLPAVDMGDGELLPAVNMGDGSVMPIDQFLGDGSVRPCDATSILIGLRGGGGAGKVIFQDLHFLAFPSKNGAFGMILIGLPQEAGVGDPFTPFALNFAVVPPAGIKWTQLNGILIGLNQGDTYFCPAPFEQEGSIPSSGFEEIGFNPQPDPPAECVMLIN